MVGLVFNLGLDYVFLFFEGLGTVLLGFIYRLVLWFFVRLSGFFVMWGVFRRGEEFSIRYIVVGINGREGRFRM